MLIDAFCFIAPQLVIDDKQGERVPFRFNKAQLRILEAAKSQELAGRPIRLRILKCRQSGISLLSTMLSLFRTVKPGAHQALSIADKLQLPSVWLRRCKAWIDQMVGLFGEYEEIGASNANELWFRGTNSRYYIASAEGQTPGMGETIQTIHCSEVASWADPDKVLFDLLPAVPPGPQTCIIQESTGRAVGDWWYQRYQEAKIGQDGFTALFLPWFLQSEYSCPGQDPGELSDYERSLLGLGATPEQLVWRRREILDKFHGDETAFANQYPATEDEAFLAAGREVFTREEVAQARKTVRNPVWRGEIIPASDPKEYRLLETVGGRLLIWEYPKEKFHYAVGADSQWGRRTSSDYDAAHVECVETGKICARWWGRANMGDWAKMMASLGYYYNIGLLAPERNSLAAEGVILPLLGLSGNSWRYPRLYVRAGLKSYGLLRPEDYGWLTDEHTKPQMVMMAHQRMSEAEGMDWADEGAVSEMAAYIVDDSSRMTAPPGQHDDRLIGRLIASMAARQWRAQLATEPEPEPNHGPMRTMAERLAEHFATEEEEPAEITA